MLRVENKPEGSWGTCEGLRGLSDFVLLKGKDLSHGSLCLTDKISETKHV